MATSPAKRKTACAEIQGSSMQASTPSGKKRGSEALIESDIKELHGHQGSEWRLRPGPPTLGTNGALTCPLSPLVTFAHLCGHPEGFRMVAHTVTVAARSLLCRCCARRMWYLKVLIYTRFDRVKLLTDEQKLAAAHEFEGTLPEFGRWLNQLTPHAHYVHEVHLVRLRGLPTGSSIGDLVVGLRCRT